MSRKFEIIDFRVKKIEVCLNDYFAPQIKIKGRGWYYIFLGNNNNWLLLKRRWNLSESYSDDPICYGSKSYAEEYKDTIRYAINYLRFIKDNKKFSMLLPGDNILELLREADDFSTKNSYYRVVENIKVSWLRL
jgi:hypothetical protein